MYISVEIQKDMQKFITLFIFACIICSCEKSDNKPSQPRYLVLTRTVKMLPTEYQKGKEMKEVYTYNDFGYEDSFILYVDGENVEERKNYKHDEQGRVLHWEAFAPDGRKGLTMDYTYSASGKILVEDKVFLPTAESGYGAETNHYLTQYTYDEQDREIQQLSYLNDEVLGVHTNYKYDNSGNLLLVHDVDKDGQLKMKYEATYNRVGKIEKSTVISYLSFGTLTTTWEYSYDSEGYLILEEGYQDGKPAHVLKDHKYDEAGNLLSCNSCGVDGVVYTEYYYTYQRFD